MYCQEFGQNFPAKHFGLSRHCKRDEWFSVPRARQSWKRAIPPCPQRPPQEVWTSCQRGDCTVNKTFILSAKEFFWRWASLKGDRTEDHCPCLQPWGHSDSLQVETSPSPYLFSFFSYCICSHCFWMRLGVFSDAMKWAQGGWEVKLTQVCFHMTQQ